MTNVDPAIKKTYSAKADPKGKDLWQITMYAEWTDGDEKKSESQTWNTTGDEAKVRFEIAQYIKKMVADRDAIINNKAFAMTEEEALNV